MGSYSDENRGPYRKRGYAFNKNGQYIPGSMSNYYIKTETKTKGPADEDSNNRKKVLNRLKELIEAGKNIEEAVDIVIQDNDIVSKFDYLKKNGLDIKQIFRNWYISYSKTIESEKTLDGFAKVRRGNDNGYRDR